MIGPLARPLAQSASNSLLAGARGGSAFSPSQLTGLVQRFLDANPTYYASTLNSYPILTPEETGTVAVPRAGRCWTFDGANDYGTLGARLTSGSVTAFTVAMWVKPATIAVQHSFAHESNSGGTQGWYTGSDSTDKTKVYLYFGNGPCTALSPTGVLSAGAWTHLVFIYDGSMTGNANRAKIYANGSQLSLTFTGTVPSSISDHANPFQVGQYPPGSVYLNGSLSDVRVYNVAKSAGEIAAIYNQSATPNTIDTTGLIAHYPCAEESGTIGYDASGNGKHLTLTNITQATFHAADTGVKWSLPNQKGYTLANNLLTYSEQFDNAAWGKSGVSVTANASLAPNGTTTADLIVESASNALHFSDMVSVTAVAGRTYTASVYLKANGRSFATVGVPSESSWITFDLAAGSVGLVTGSASGTITSAGNGWYRCSVTLTTTGTYGRGLFVAVQNANQSLVTYAGDGVSGVFVWGAQLELGSTASPYAATTSTALSNTVIPASLSTPSQDAAGNALGVTGPVCYPATVEVPCVTGDGSAVYCDLGSALIPASADFTTTLKYYHVTNNTARRTIACQDDAGHSTGAWYLYANISGGAPTAGAVWFSVQGASSVSVTSALTAGAWHDITISRAGSTFTLTVTAVGGSAVTANATMAPTILVTNTWLLKRNDATAYHNDGRISDLRITTGGVTTYFPLQEGPGSSNTNRDLYYCKSDGTSGTVSGAIVNGTVSTIWANRCPYAQDWSINYGGGIAANGAFVPGRIGSANDAAGNAKTLSAGKFGNPYSRLCPNAWAAPALVNIGYTASSKLAPTDTVQATSPADTKFRRNASTGSDRYFATLAALTGSDKTNAETYAG